MTADVFQRYSEYYDLLYRDKDYEAETDYIARTLREAKPNIRSVLEFGSGTGKHGRLLAQRGFDVLGIERSASMVQEAKRPRLTNNESGSFECMEGDVRTTNIGRAFDAVIALFHVVSYQTNDDDVRATFANAAAHLTAGGLFFFDVWHAPAVLHERPSIREKEVENEVVRLKRVAVPELDERTNTVTVNYSIAATHKIDNRSVEFGETHRMRYFQPDEINAFAISARFAIDASEAFLTSARPSNGTWGVAYLLRKF